MSNAQKNFEKYLANMKYQIVKDGEDYLMIVEGQSIARFINRDKVSDNFFKAAVQMEWDFFMDDLDFTESQVDLRMLYSELIADKMWNVRTDKFTYRWGKG